MTCRIAFRKSFQNLKLQTCPLKRRTDVPGDPPKRPKMPKEITDLIRTVSDAKQLLCRSGGTSHGAYSHFKSADLTINVHRNSSNRIIVYCAAAAPRPRRHPGAAPRPARGRCPPRRPPKTAKTGQTGPETARTDALEKRLGTLRPGLRRQRGAKWVPSARLGGRLASWRPRELAARGFYLL